MASGIYLLPVELLLMIFAPLRKRDLAALRLTSKHFEDVASQIYLDSVTIALRRQTLVDLDTIIRHPGLKRSVRRVTFDVSQYDDSVTAREVYAQRLVAKLEEELEIQMLYTCVHHNYRPLGRKLSRQPCKEGVLCSPKRILELQDWLKICEEFPAGRSRTRLWLTRRRAASIVHGYARYCEFAKEQKLLSQSQAHVRLLEQALKCMPRVNSLRVMDLSNAVLRSSITFDNRNGHNAFCLDRTLVIDPQYMAAFRLDRILLAWEKHGRRLEEFNCYEAGAFLQMLPTRLTRPLPPEWNVFKNLVTLKLKIGYDKEDSPEELHDRVIEKLSSGAFKLMLAQAISLQALTIDGGASIMLASFPLNSIFALASWRDIRHIGLRRLVLDFEDFMTFCVLHQTTLVSLAFDGVMMNEISWWRAVEVFRIALRLEKIRFHEIHDQLEGRFGYTATDEETMARYILNQPDLLVNFVR